MTRVRDHLIFIVGFVVAIAGCTWRFTPVCVADAPRVKLDAGEIEGLRKDGLHVFKGIPYAAPPVGPHRWRAPQPVKPWTGVRKTVDYGSDAPQATMLSAHQDEDCLYLNVWAPANSSDTPYPVMVWIHGGGFINGSGRLNGEALARQGVVLVSFNYRLGRLGSFAHPALLKGLPKDEPPANFWMQDQIAALRWVQKNIKPFGGDPKRVTIFGVSAGGTSVNMLMASPLAEGLFQRAIAQSGVGGFGPYRRLREEHRGRESLVSLGERFVKAQAVDGKADSAAALRALPWKTVAKIGKNVEDREGFEGIVDGVSLLDDLPATFEKGQQHKVPFLAGANSFEGNLSLVIPWTDQPPRSTVEAKLSRLAPLYGRKADDTAIWNDLYGDVYFRVSTLNLVSLMERAKTPAWMYHFDYVRGRGKNSRGAGHGSEVPFVMGSVLFPSGQDRAIIDAMQGHWVQFARTGDPNGKSLPAWPPYTSKEPRTMVYGQKSTEAVHGLDRPKFDILFQCVREAFDPGAEKHPARKPL